MIFYRWKNVKTAITGKDHITDGKPCQDKVASYTKNGIYAIALADGAGSRSASEIGADIVTRSAVKFLVEEFDDLIISTENQATDDPATAFQTLRERLIVHITEALNQYLISHSKVAYRDLASTLLFVVFKDDQYIMGHIGDGLIASYQYRLGEVYTKMMSKPENGAASNITFFFTESDVDKHFRLYKGSMNNILGFALMSDGPEEVLYDEKTGLSPNLKNFFKNFQGKNEKDYENQITQLLEQRIAQMSYDDLSINLIYLDQWLYNGIKVDDDFIDGIRSLDQIKRVSKDGYLLDRSIDGLKVQFTTFNQMLDYVRSRL